MWHILLLRSEILILFKYRWLEMFYLEIEWVDSVKNQKIIFAEYLEVLFLHVCVNK